MKILIIGSSGQLGHSIQKVVTKNNNTSEKRFEFVDRKQLDLSNNAQISAYFDKHRFDVIVNCAAYTKVDQAESEPETANKINHLAVKTLAEISRDNQSKLIHISTDYVFDGNTTSPYLENNATDPLNTYGKSKQLGEIAIQEVMTENAIIIRTSWMYSEYGANFVKTMLKFGSERQEINIINDQIGSPTYAENLAHAILEILNHPNFEQPSFKTDLYHYADQGSCSWYELAQEVFSLSSLACQAKPIPSKQYPLPAKRPNFSALNTNKIKQKFNLTIPQWQTSLRRCIDLLR